MGYSFMKTRAHSPAPMFEQHACTVRLVGWICLQCGIELRIPLQISRPPAETARPGSLENARNITVLATV